MSVYRCEYIIYGWKLPYTKEASRKLKEESSSSYPFLDGLGNGYELIIDDMGGQFIVFGKVIYKNNLPYADTASDKPMEFEDLTLPSTGDKEEVFTNYYECFGTNRAVKDTPKTFIFSHIY